MAKYAVTYQLIGCIVVEAKDAKEALKLASSKEDEIIIENAEFLSMWNEDTDEEESPW